MKGRISYKAPIFIFFMFFDRTPIFKLNLHLNFELEFNFFFLNSTFYTIQGGGPGGAKPITIL